MMRSKRLFWVVFGLSTLLQLVLMAGMAVLQRLARTRAGVNHHLYYRGVQYRHAIFTPANVLVAKVALAVLLVLLAVWLVYTLKKGGRGAAVLTLLPLLWVGLLLCTLHLAVFTQLLVFPYLVAAEGVVLALMLANRLLYPRRAGDKPI